MAKVVPFGTRIMARLNSAKARRVAAVLPIACSAISTLTTRIAIAAAIGREADDLIPARPIRGSGPGPMRKPINEEEVDQARCLDFRELGSNRCPLCSCRNGWR